VQLLDGSGYLRLQNEAAVRRIHRSDHTQEPIIEALRRVGVQVECIGRPLDLLCGHRGVWFVLECKTGKGVFTKDQAEFLARAQGPVHIVRTPEEALRAVLGEQHVQGDTLRV
jgi:hypothetical protein